jgi:hypothetical protein
MLEKIKDFFTKEGIKRASQHNFNQAEAGYNAKWFKRGALFGYKTAIEENRYTLDELKLWMKSRDVYLYNYYTTYKQSGIPMITVEEEIRDGHEYLMDRKLIE